MLKKWNYAFEVPDKKRVRMIVHTDCKNEADDQYALAHHLMTPKFIVTGIVAAHFHGASEYKGIKDTVGASYDEIIKVLDLMDVDGKDQVYRGSNIPLVDEQTPQESEGAKYIVEEAMKDDPHPLYIACQGSLTDVASAILMEPAICERMTVIWIGGGIYPKGGREFNLSQDIAAANVLFKSQMPVWQVPMDVYKQMGVSLAELQYHVSKHGAIGKYLFEQMVDLNNQLGEMDFFWPHGEIWGLGDSPTIGLLLEEVEKTDVYTMMPAPIFDYETMEYIHGQDNREIRVYNDANARLTLSDFFAKLALNFPEEA